MRRPFPSPAGLLILALCCVATTVAAQPSHLSLSATGGKVIPTSGSPFSGNNPTMGFDACLLWQHADASVYWHRFWRNPYIGIRTGYAHVIDGIAGDRFVLAGTIQAPATRHVEWTFSTGLSFYTTPYNHSHNPRNIYIGSVVNCLIDLGFLYDLPLDGNTTLFLSAKLVHSSNGYMYKPNHGLNYMQGEVGVRLGPGRHPMRMPQADTAFVPYGKGFIMLAPSAVMSRYDPLDHISYHPAYTCQVGYVRHVHPCFAVGGAFDLSYNFSHSLLAPGGQLPVYPGATLFVDNQWGPFVLRLGVAHYLGYYPLNWEQYYERVALYYRFGPSQDHYAGVGMKVHGDHVDFIEWTYAFEF